MALIEIKNGLYDYAEDCGMKPRNSRPVNGNQLPDRICVNEAQAGYGFNAIVRDNANVDNNQNGTPYFGFICPEEETSGQYSDLSLVFFPLENENHDLCIVVSLCLGSQGLKNDIQEATLPGTRRLFMRLHEAQNEQELNFFIKNDFSSQDTVLKGLFDELANNGYVIGNLRNRYGKYMQVNSYVVFPDGNMNEVAMNRLKSWIAVYAKFRSWPHNGNERNSVYIYYPNPQNRNMSIDEIRNILDHDHYIVLQGAPGTGKTYTAQKIANKDESKDKNKKLFKRENVFFTQFHGETSYSDFVWGIRPKLNADSLQYEAQDGVLLKAIKAAEKAKEAAQNPVEAERVLLIIDEINRANLSNVLGPVFFLFENSRLKDKKKDDKKKDEVVLRMGIEIGGETFYELPNNLYVIATMNTADRSLAVVDFALRRRFTWITLRPHVLKFKEEEGRTFHDGDFQEISDIFERYATDDELNLQPGHSYFITDNGGNADELMRQRLQYELMPLIKEYLAEGYLSDAKDEFSNYFFNRLHVFMYE